MDLDIEQLKLEQEMIDIGVNKYRASLAKALETGTETTVSPQHKLLSACITPLADKIREEVVSAGKAGRNKTALGLLKATDADVISFITAQTVINAISVKLTTVNIERRITTMIKDYLLLDAFKKSNPNLYKFANKKAQESSHQQYRINRMRHYADWNETDISEHKASILTGAYLLETFIQTTGLVEKVNVKIGGKTKQYIEASPQVVTWLEQAHKETELMSPYFLPMVVKPEPWTNPYDGGYKTQGLPVIKVKNQNYIQELEGADMDGIYRAINALQETPWRIKKPILEVINTLWESGVETKILPSRVDLELPAKPFANEEDYEEFIAKNKQAWIEWKKKATAVHTLNRRGVSKRVALSQKLWMANKFASYDEIFFIHNMDWRGRVYPVVPLLNPQSDDLGKALLEFAYGAPMGDTGEKWLKIHLANTFGVDKVSMEERIKWTDDHLTVISLIANDPYTYKLWQDADSPWQFLSACMEWEAYVTSGLGSSYVSHLVINMDGSCNGLQNFSAMLRDEVGGSATNLVPHDIPADIYTEVMKVVQQMITDDLALGKDVELAKLWDGKLSRKLVKRQVMTLPYGSTEYGMRDQLKQELHNQKGDGKDILGNIEPDLEWKAISYLTTHIWNAIGQVVVASRLAMDWLKDSAKIASTQDLPLRWTTPSGLPVLQEYKKSKEKVLDTFFGKVRIVRKLQETTKVLNANKQANGVAPNFVHSMDASHMVSTINQCLDIGIQDFCMIHDSYGTHAGRVEALQNELRDAFIKQYTPNVLENLRQELMEQTGLEIPEPPKVGNLDLELIRDSKYFFA
jgi:DNA-directed RNA polymerase